MEPLRFLKKSGFNRRMSKTPQLSHSPRMSSADGEDSLPPSDSMSPSAPSMPLPLPTPLTTSSMVGCGVPGSMLCPRLWEKCHGVGPFSKDPTCGDLDINEILFIFDNKPKKEAELTCSSFAFLSTAARLMWRGWGCLPRRPATQKRRERSAWRPPTPSRSEELIRHCL